MMTLLQLEVSLYMSKRKHKQYIMCTLGSYCPEPCLGVSLLGRPSSTQLYCAIANGLYVHLVCVCVCVCLCVEASGYDAIFAGVEPLLERLPPHHRSTLDTLLIHLAKLVHTYYYVQYMYIHVQCNPDTIGADLIERCQRYLLIYVLSHSLLLPPFSLSEPL